jgi:hypothetical protein
METSPTNASRHAGDELDRRISEALMSSLEDVRPSDRVWGRIVRRVTDLECAVRRLEHREKSIARLVWRPR